MNSGEALLRGFPLLNSGAARMLRSVEMKGYSRSNLILVVVALCGLLGELVGGVVFNEPLAGIIIGLDLSAMAVAIVYICRNY
jgi:hypothetical protein